MSDVRVPSAREQMSALLAGKALRRGLGPEFIYLDESGELVQDDGTGDVEIYAGETYTNYCDVVAFDRPKPATDEELVAEFRALANVCRKTALPLLSSEYVAAHAEARGRARAFELAAEMLETRRIP
jgi:hypothetical protein